MTEACLRPVKLSLSSVAQSSNPVGSLNRGEALLTSNKNYSINGQHYVRVRTRIRISFLSQ